MKINTILICLTALVSIDCSTKSESDLTTVNHITIQGLPDPVNISKFHYGDPKAYVNFYTTTDYKFGILSAQDSPLAPRRLYAYSDGESSNTLLTKSTRERAPIMTINGLSVTKELDVKSNYKTSISPLFGQVVSFGVGCQTKAELDENQLYIPQIISITSPQISPSAQKLPLCDANSFILKWNEDTMNDNGVIVQIEWDGIVLFGKHRDNSHVNIAKIYPDVGYARLNSEMFEGIPDTALCHLTILRGNVDIIVVDDQSFKIGGSSHETMDFVLLRNIRSK